MRDLEAANHLEVFFVSAVSAILLIRAFLHFSRYVQLGGDTLHIAHMLWGGLLMSAALILLLTFLSRRVQRVAALLGGLGFGTFLDEIGKFVTRDNDYFYQPAISLMYVTLVLTFVGARLLRRGGDVSGTEYLVNALREFEEVALKDLDPLEQKKAQQYLDRADPDHPLVEPLRGILTRTPLVPLRPPPRSARLAHRLHAAYRRVAARPAFWRAVVVFFLAEQAVVLVATVAMFHSIPWYRALRILPGAVVRGEDPSRLQTAELGSAALAAALAVLGVARLRRFRIAAFRLLEGSALVSIFLTQVFLFYREQFLALGGLAFNILVLVTIRYALAQERLALPLRPVPPRGREGGAPPGPARRGA